MGIPYRVAIKVLASARTARRAIRHAGILAQDGQPHRRPAAKAGTTTAAGLVPARTVELSYDGLKGTKRFIGIDEKFDDLSN
jgi:hypothetical protein